MAAKVFQKLVEVRKAVGPIEKSGQNEYQGYTYQTADEVFTRVRSAMNDVGLMLFPNMTDVRDANGSWVIQFEMVWADMESGETYTGQWAMTVPQKARSSNGDYVDDKALGKAGTYALRYYLLRTLMITTKDDVVNDIDAGSPDTLPQRGTSKRKDNPFPPRSQDGDDSQEAAANVDEVNWPKFWMWVKGLGLTQDEARQAVGVNSLSKWIDGGGAKDEMMKRVQAYAKSKTDEGQAA